MKSIRHLMPLNNFKYYSSHYPFKFIKWDFTKTHYASDNVWI